MPNQPFPANSELPFYVEFGAEVISRHATAAEALTEAQTLQASYGDSDGAYTAFDKHGTVVDEDYLHRSSDRYEKMTAHLAE